MVEAALSYLIPADYMKDGALAEIKDAAAREALRNAAMLIKKAGDTGFAARDLDPSDLGLTDFTISATSAGTVNMVDRRDIDEQQVIVIYGFILKDTNSKVDKITIKKGASTLAVFRFDEKGALDHPIWISKRFLVFGPKDTLTIQVDVNDATTEDVVILAVVAEPKGRTITK